MTLAPQVAISPDGRWLVFSAADSPTRASLWIIPSAGGRPTRLTDAGFADDNPRFVPSGDRILFRSTRPAKATIEGMYLMSLPFDRAAGRASGPPTQLTFEPVLAPVVSNDGNWIAYRAISEDGFPLKVIPVNGGNARVLHNSKSRQAGVLAWSRDGASILIVGRGEKLERVVSRVPVNGGPPVVLFETGKAVRAAAPDGSLFALGEPGGLNGRTHTIEVVDATGRVLYQHDVKSAVFPAGFSTAGDALYLVADDVSAYMRVRGVTDGTMRDLSAGKDYPWALDWLDDSKTLAYVGDQGLLMGTLNAGPRRVSATSGREQFESASATHGLLAVPTAATRLRIEYYVVDLKTGARSLLTKTGLRTDATAAGGDYARVGDGFLYFEERGNNAALLLTRPGQPPRTLRLTTSADALRHAYSVHGSRIAFTKETGDSLGLFIADSPTAPGRLIATLGPAAAPGCCRLNLVFSPDGRWLVASRYGKRTDRDLLYIEVPAQGRATNIRVVQVPADYWYEARWLPDNRGVTVIGGVVNDADIFLIPFRESEKPVNLTAADTDATWGHVLSPDGRYIAYASEVRRGSAIWRVDLPKR
jgi:Tol biopolymer transport system component